MAKSQDGKKLNPDKISEICTLPPEAAAAYIDDLIVSIFHQNLHHLRVPVLKKLGEVVCRQTYVKIGRLASGIVNCRDNDVAAEAIRLLKKCREIGKTSKNPHPSDFGSRRATRTHSVHPGTDFVL